MGQQTDFYGKLEFTRSLNGEELHVLDRIINAGNYSNAEIREAVDQQAEARRQERGGRGPLIFDPHDGADLRSERLGFVVGEGLSPHYARALRISDDGGGLVYCSEKTYDMIAGVNFIIANGRQRIPGFGLKGSLYASTEFEPHSWLVKINADGWADQIPCPFSALPLAERQMIEETRKRQWQAWEEVGRRRREVEKKQSAGIVKRILSKLQKLHL